MTIFLLVLFSCKTFDDKADDAQCANFCSEHGEKVHHIVEYTYAPNYLCTCYNIHAEYFMYNGEIKEFSIDESSSANIEDTAICDE